jgi:hypothetical protein
MATLVLGTIGRVVGGPIGQVVGALFGNVIDREVLFKPKGREGPRLSELAVQTSSYGTQIPKLFGTMRVAGTVIWSTDLIEHRSTEGGKGKPTTTSYSYTASFAVALSAREVLGMARIWADGKLLRGAAGDFKSGFGAFRLHLGGEDQEADPLIVAAEGVGQAPAHRGVAYAVFEDLQLGDFGNRIPALTFEVQADAGPVAAGDVLGEIAGGDIASAGESQALGGFSAYGASVRAVAETLAGADGAWFASAGDTLQLSSGSGGSFTISDSGAHARGHASARGNRSIAAADTAPRTLTLAHYDPARDYQIGVQRAARPGAGTREARVELPGAGADRCRARAAERGAGLGGAGDSAGRSGDDRRRAGSVASRSLGAGGDGGDARLRRVEPGERAGERERGARAGRARPCAGSDDPRGVRIAAARREPRERAAAGGGGGGDAAGMAERGAAAERRRGALGRRGIDCAAGGDRAGRGAAGRGGGGAGGPGERRRGAAGA